jgi:hypothetical protein
MKRGVFLYLYGLEGASDQAFEFAECHEGSLCRLGLGWPLVYRRVGSSVNLFRGSWVLGAWRHASRRASLERYSSE